MAIVVIGNVNTPNGGTGGSTTWFRTDFSAPSGSRLTQVRINKYGSLSGSSVGKVKMFKVNGSNYDITDIASFTITLGTGVQTISISPSYSIPTSGTYYVGVWIPTGDTHIGYVFVGTNSNAYYNGEATGNNVSFTSYPALDLCIETTFDTATPISMGGCGGSSGRGTLAWAGGSA
jgi:hypothetical protein